MFLECLLGWCNIYLSSLTNLSLKFFTYCLLDHLWKPLFSFSLSRVRMYFSFYTIADKFGKESKKFWRKQLKCFPSKFSLSFNYSFSIYSLLYLPCFFHFPFSTLLGPRILTILIYLISALHWNSKHKIALHTWLRNQLFKIQIIFRLSTDYIHATFDQTTGKQWPYLNSKQEVCYIRWCSLIYMKYRILDLFKHTITIH